jgi:hypothetical protein
MHAVRQHAEAGVVVLSLEAGAVSVLDRGSVDDLRSTLNVLRRQDRGILSRGGLGLERLGRPTVVCRVAVFAPRGIDPEAPRAVGRFVHVYVDPATRRPVPVPAPVRRALEEPTASENQVPRSAAQASR